MADEEGPFCKVEYIDENPEESNWIKRAGKAKVTYVNGSTFEGTFDNERVKQGYGVYIWMKQADDESFVEKARYEGNYKDGLRSGFGKMIFPNGDIYEGAWVDNKMHGEGSYTYKKTDDIYSGSWANNLKNGEGRYEFGKDRSMFVGLWSNGQLNSGTWVLKGAGKYTGDFKLGRPIGEGKFEFLNGIAQEGEYVVTKLPDEEEPQEGEPAKPPNVTWKGRSIVSF